MAVELIQNSEKNTTELEFQNIVNQIEISLSPEEKEMLSFEPQMKSAGSQDQGFRYD